MLVVVIILVPSVQGRTGIAWPLVAIVGLAGHGLLLDRSVQEHLGREQRRRQHATDLIRQRLALMEPRDPEALRLDTTPSEAQARLVLPCRGTLWTTS